NVIYFTGRTNQGRPNYPVTSGSYDTTHNGDFDVFVTSFSIEKPEPLEVYSVKAYSDPSYLEEIDMIDIGETIYMELLGLDNNATYRGAATVNITSTSTITIPIVISLPETDINTGVYRGSFLVPPSIEYLENITIESRMDASKKTVVQVNTPVLIMPVYDNMEIDEDEELEVIFHNAGYNPFSTWTFRSSAYWMNWDEGSRKIFGTPDNSMIEVFWVNISASDDSYHIDHVNFTLEVVNVHPCIMTENVMEALEDEEYFVDYQCSDEGCGSTLWSIYNPLADWLQFDCCSGILNGTPENNDVGSYDLNISVDDGNGGINWTVFTLQVFDVNDPPVIQTIPYSTVLQGENYYVQMNARDVDDINIFEWTMITNAGFLSIDNVTGVITGDPENNDVGSYFLNITVYDKRGMTDSINTTLEVIDINDPPEWVDFPMNSKIDEGIHYRFRMKAVDIDKDDVIRYSVKTNPDSGMKIDPDTGLLEWISTTNGLDPDMSYTLNIEVTASDGELGSTHGFYLRVIPNEAPWTILESPSSGGKVASTGAYLVWSAEDKENDNLSYDLFVHGDRDKVMTLDVEALIGEDLSDTSFTFDEVESQETYFWTVIPSDDLRRGFCRSDIGSFYVNTIPVLEVNATYSVFAGDFLSVSLSPKDPDPKDQGDLKLTLLDGVDDDMYLVGSVLSWSDTLGKEGDYTITINVSDGLESSEWVLDISVLEKEAVEEPEDDDGSIGLIFGLSVLSLLILAAVISAIVFIFVKKGKRTDEGEEVKTSGKNEGLESEMTGEENPNTTYHGSMDGI
ncbi:MAG: putative Ig domain-containing protein, partial [Thermoplasmatota archaeon]